MECQKNKFNLHPDSSYLDCANMSPMLNSAKEALMERVAALAEPVGLARNTFFGPVHELRSDFAQLIGCSDPDRIGVGPSASYGIANIARQIRPVRGSNIVMVSEQFPSNYYSWKRLADDFGCEIRSVGPDSGGYQRGAAWNERLLSAIDSNTAVVAVPFLHYSDGTLFDIKQIAEQARQHNALMIADASQAAGMLPIATEDLGLDALVCAGYKWVFGPYGTGLAYYGDFFDNGIPIEENWIIYEGAEDFAGLSNYNPNLKPKGLRYSSGEHPALLNLPVLKAGVRQVLEWDCEAMLAYVKGLFEPMREDFERLGCEFETPEYSAPHIKGFRFRQELDNEDLKNRLEARGVYTSIRASCLRISLNVYNDENDMDKLLEVLKGVLN